MATTTNKLTNAAVINAKPKDKPKDKPYKLVNGGGSQCGNVISLKFGDATNKISSKCRTQSY